MAISNRRGRLLVSKEIYEDEKNTHVFFALQVKIFRISYDPYSDTYEIYFTSPFIDEVANGFEQPDYTITYTPYGFYFTK